jgi:hypothetical protein
MTPDPKKVIRPNFSQANAADQIFRVGLPIFVLIYETSLSEKFREVLERYPNQVTRRLVSAFFSSSPDLGEVRPAYITGLKKNSQTGRVSEMEIQYLHPHLGHVYKTYRGQDLQNLLNAKLRWGDSKFMWHDTSRDVYPPNFKGFDVINGKPKYGTPNEVLENTSPWARFYRRIFG